MRQEGSLCSFQTRVAAGIEDLEGGRIVAIEPKGEEATFDLTVDRDHNFVADGLVVHNSHSAAYAVISSTAPVNVVDSFGSDILASVP